MRRVLLPHHISGEPAPMGGVIHDFAGTAMGTSWSVRLAAPAGKALPAEVRQGLQEQLDAVVAEMSHWEADSSLGRFNRAAAGAWHTLPRAFFDVLAFALEVSELTGGACDPGAGAIVNAWGFGPAGGWVEQLAPDGALVRTAAPRHDEPAFAAPDAGQIDALRAQRQAVRLQLDHATRRVLQPGGVQLDLSAVAKGYSVDRLAHYLTTHGVRHFLVEVGGELRGAGMKPDGQPWWVELEQVGQAGHAPDAAVPPSGIVLALHGLSVATSGDYRRYFVRDGQRYSHTIDPRTARPIANRLASVTVLHPHCMAADAWSTALTVLGPERGMAMAERQGLAARFVVRSDGGDGGGDDSASPQWTELLSSAMRAMLEDNPE